MSSDDSAENDFTLADFRAAFLAEIRELILAFEDSVLRLEHDASDVEALNEAFRNAHSIKGASAAAGHSSLAELTHQLEAMLDGWRDGSLEPTAEHFAVLLECSDLLGKLLDDSTPETLEAAKATAQQLERLCAAGETAAPADGTSSASQETSQAPQALQVHVRFDPEAFQFGGDPLLAIRELLEFDPSGEIILDDSNLPSLEQMQPELAYVNYKLSLQCSPDLTQASVQDAFSFFGDEVHLEFIEPAAPTTSGELEEPAATTETPATQQPAQTTAEQDPPAAKPQDRRAAHEPSTVRVSTAKLDRVIDLVGELVIAQSAVREIARGYTTERAAALNEAVLVAEQHLRELQERVMAVRMVPIGAVFSRIPRLVRDVARKLNKSVHLEVEGADTELDKTLIEHLLDPLMHLVRNAIDHGIESPEERVAAGKPEQATLQLRSFGRAGKLYIEVEDDGKGIDPDFVRRRAIERGVIAPDDDQSEEEILQVLCMPGFSTKTTATDISGRGVGLDVVQRNIEALNGTLRIRSTLGAGSCFSLRLPLTLTIVDGLLVSERDRTCVLPLTDVAFSIRLTPQKVRTVVGNGEVVDLDDETLPLLDLARILRLPDNVESQRELAVVVHSGHTRFALRVEKLLGQSQVVVKSIETHYRRIPGLMGATILGDGKVALILDGQGLAAAAGYSHAEVISATNRGTAQEQRYAQ